MWFLLAIGVTLVCVDPIIEGCEPPKTDNPAPKPGRGPSPMPGIGHTSPMPGIGPSPLPQPMRPK